jgi:polyribonucleotide nucleotidyltransferase
MNQNTSPFFFGRHTVSIEPDRGRDPFSSTVKLCVDQSVVLANCSLARTPSDQLDQPTVEVALTERGYAKGKMLRRADERDDLPSPADRGHEKILRDLLASTLPTTFAASVRVDIRVIARDARADPLLAAFLAASSAISLASELRVEPAALGRIGLIAGEFVLNPHASQLRDSQLDLYVCGVDGYLTQARGHGFEISESTLVKGIAFCQEELQACSEELKNRIAPFASETVNAFAKPLVTPMHRRVRSLSKAGIFEILGSSDQIQQARRLESLRKAVQIAMCVMDEAEDRSDAVSLCFDVCLQSVIRERCLGGHLRTDGRAPSQSRDRTLLTGTLPISHGSASHVVCESETLAVATLGADRAPLDKTSGFRDRRFAVHLYPQSTGRGDKQSLSECVEIGHWITEALRPVMPTAEMFPYATRVDLEQLGTERTPRDQAVAAATHALLDAGVPLRGSVAAVEIGLLRSPSHFMTLSDIDRHERGACDLVATLAGTQAGLTGIYLNSRCRRLTTDTLEVILRQALESRLNLLAQMSQALDKPRELSDQAPRIQVLHISARKTGQLVGRAGSTVKSICRSTHSHIEVFQDGTVRVSANSDAALQKAIIAIHEVLRPLKEGQLYEGTVAEILENAVVVSLNAGREGVLPLSEMLAPDSSVDDQFAVGDRVRVVCQAIDPRGGVSLSMQAIYDTQGDRDDETDQLLQA